VPINLDDLIPENMKPIMVEAQAKTDWSSYQQAFFHAVETTSDNLVMEAVAGSGKTTTILEGMRRTGSTDVLFLAFNKSIQVELASRVPMGVTTKTLNALGNSVLAPHIRARKLNQYKPQNVLREMLKDDIYKEYGWPLARLLSSARHNGIGIRTALGHEVWQDFLLNSDVFVPEERVEQFAEILRLAFSTMLDNFSDDFDFDDQLYMPIFKNWTFPLFHTVFIDEAQDLSFINHMQLVRLRDRGARIIAVGDSKQAIYAFRGADSRSMGNLAKTFDAQILPLSICYRCGKEIVRHAQRLVPYIEYHEASPLGTLVHHEETLHPTDFEQKSMVICRNNAPLFSLALHFLREKVPCYIVGDLAGDLIRLIDRLSASTSAQLILRLREWQEIETKKAIAMRRDHLIDAIDDKVNSLIPFCEEYPFPLQIKAAIQHLQQNTTGPRLSSIHKAKGMEAEHVYILRPDLMPAKRALDAYNNGDDSALEQEKNLEYVAITRAKLFLHYLPSGA